MSFKLLTSSFISRTEYVRKEETTPSHSTSKGTMGIKYVKTTLPNLNGMINGVVKRTVMGENNIARILASLRSWHSKMAQLVLHQPLPTEVDTTLSLEVLEVKPL